MFDIAFHDRFVLGESDVADRLVHLLHDQYDAVHSEHAQGLGLRGIRIHRHIAIGGYGVEHCDRLLLLNRGLLTVDHEISQFGQENGSVLAEVHIRQFSIDDEFVPRERRRLVENDGFHPVIRRNHRQIVLRVYDSHRQEHRDDHQ